MTLLVILDMEPYIIWPQISPIMYKMYTYILLLATVVMTINFLNYSIIMKNSVPVGAKNKTSLSLLLSSLFIIILFFYEVFCSGVVGGTMQPFNASMLCINIGLMLFCMLDNYTLRDIYTNVKKIFAITLIPGIIIFVLIQILGDLPYTMLTADSGKDITGQAYRLYFGVATMLENGGGFLNRLCGIYREPGFVGTIGALLLVGDKLSLKKWENKVILIALLCTFSLAFVLILAVAWLLYKLYDLRDRKKAAGGIVAILFLFVVYFVFINIPLSEDSGLGELQARLEITEEGLAGDNRISSSEYAVYEYEQFIKSGAKVVLFGHGVCTEKVPGTKVNIWQNVCSYQEFVYYFGFIGLAIVIAWLVLTVLSKYSRVYGQAKWNILVLLAVFVISIYQRYDVTNLHYLCILLGGCANCALIGMEKDENDLGVNFN